MATSENFQAPLLSPEDDERVEAYVSGTLLGEELALFLEDLHTDIRLQEAVSLEAAIRISVREHEKNRLRAFLSNVADPIPKIQPMPAMFSMAEESQDYSKRPIVLRSRSTEEPVLEGPSPFNLKKVSIGRRIINRPTWIISLAALILLTLGVWWWGSIISLDGDKNGNLAQEKTQKQAPEEKKGEVTNDAGKSIQTEPVPGLRNTDANADTRSSTQTTNHEDLSESQAREGGLDQAPLKSVSPNEVPPPAPPPPPDVEFETQAAPSVEDRAKNNYEFKDDRYDSRTEEKDAQVINKAPASPSSTQSSPRRERKKGKTANQSTQDEKVAEPEVFYLSGGKDTLHQEYLFTGVELRFYDLDKNLVQNLDKVANTWYLQYKDNWYLLQQDGKLHSLVPIPLQEVPTELR